MIKKILIGFLILVTLIFITLYIFSRPKLESDGSYSPSPLALKLATAPKTDYKEVVYDKYLGDKSKILIIFTEQKKLTMKNGKIFSTGNHPVEALVPMLHLKNAGFDLEVATPTGKPVVFEMWAFPKKDTKVKKLYNEYKYNFNHPKKLENFVTNMANNTNNYAAIFIPGGHGAMLGIPEDKNVGKILNWAHINNLFTITLCHGPSSLLATTLDNKEFIYKDYKMAVFPDKIDNQTPVIGYMPGYMPFGLSKKLEELGAIIVNTESDDTVCLDRKLITGASPLASNKLGELAATTLLKELK